MNTGNGTIQRKNTIALYNFNKLLHTQAISKKAHSTMGGALTNTKPCSLIPPEDSASFKTNDELPKLGG